MFNSLAAYLLGGTTTSVVVNEPLQPQPRDNQNHQQPPRLTSVEVDDWLLIDKELPSENECEELDFADSPSGGRLTDSEGEQRSSPLLLSAPPAPPQTTNNHNHHGKHKHGARPKSRQALSNGTANQKGVIMKSRSPSCSPSRGGALGAGAPSTMDESWFLTPPPCFTSQGPGELVTGPLENLLIEHPSMSVYHQHTSSLHRYTTLESLELGDEGGVTSSSSGDEGERGHSPSPAPNVTSRNNNNGGGGAHRMDPRTARAASINRLQQREELKSGGKKTRQTRQPLKRGPLERANKAREVDARNARMRRRDHAQAQRHSRVNNNRKCC